MKSFKEGEAGGNCDRVADPNSVTSDKLSGLEDTAVYLSVNFINNYFQPAVSNYVLGKTEDTMLECRKHIYDIS